MTDTSEFTSRMIDEVAIAIAKEDMRQLDPNLSLGVIDDNLARTWIKRCKDEGQDDIRAIAIVAVERTMEMLVQEQAARDGR